MSPKHPGFDILSCTILRSILTSSLGATRSAILSGNLDEEQPGAETHPATRSEVCGRKAEHPRLGTEAVDLPTRRRRSLRPDGTHQQGRTCDQRKQKHVTNGLVSSRDNHRWLGRSQVLILFAVVLCGQIWGVTGGWGEVLRRSKGFSWFLPSSVRRARELFFSSGSLRLQSWLSQTEASNSCHF